MQDLYETSSTSHSNHFKNFEQRVRNGLDWNDYHLLYPLAYAHGSVIPATFS